VSSNLEPVEPAGPAPSPVGERPIPTDAWCADTYLVVFRAVRGLARSDAVAEELAQDALVRAIERWPRVATMDNSIGWTVTVALNLGRSRLRRLAAERRAHRRLRSSPEAETLPSPEDEVAMWDAVRALPTRQRTALVLSIIEGLSLDEVAQALGCGYSTAREHARRGRERLATELTPHEEDAR
jgi:RNA polymerase sigma-70 factor, ECF subfamily